MISFLEGAIASKGESTVVLDVNGVGYLLQMARSSIDRLPRPGERARVLCTMSVSDAGIFLYGFIDESERLAFDELVSVSGVGPKLALAALSVYDPERLWRLIIDQDVASIAKVPGIGRKTASRIALELKDSVPEGSGALADAMGALPSGAVLDPVVEALASMGFTQAEIASALEGVDEGASESQMLQYALRRMA